MASPGELRIAGSVLALKRARALLVLYAKAAPTNKSWPILMGLYELLWAHVSHIGREVAPEPTGTRCEWLVQGYHIRKALADYPIETLRKVRVLKAFKDCERAMVYRTVDDLVSGWGRICSSYRPREILRLMAELVREVGVAYPPPRHVPVD